MHFKIKTCFYSLKLFWGQMLGNLKCNAMLQQYKHPRSCIMCTGCQIMETSNCFYSCCCFHQAIWDYFLSQILNLVTKSSKAYTALLIKWSVQVCRPLSLSIYINTCFFSNQMKSMPCYTHGFNHIHNSKRPFIHKETEWTSCWVDQEIVCPTNKDNKLIRIRCFHFLFSVHMSSLWIIYLHLSLIIS